MYKHNSYLHRCHYCSWYCTYSLFDSRCVVPCHVTILLCIYSLSLCFLTWSPKCLGDNEGRARWIRVKTKTDESFAVGYDRAISRLEHAELLWPYWTKNPMLLEERRDLQACPLRVCGVHRKLELCFDQPFCLWKHSVIATCFYITF